MITILLGLAGISLIYLEFFFPGAVLAVIGTLLLLISLGIVFVNETPLVSGLYLGSVLAAVLLACRLALWRVRRSRARGDFYHGEDQEGYLAASFDPALVGMEGTAATELKPSGHISIQGKTYQAVSDKGFIDPGAPIEIVGGKGAHFIVKVRKN